MPCIPRNIRDRAVEMMAELATVKYTVNFDTTVTKLLYELAIMCGTELQPIKFYGDGSVSIFTVQGRDGGCIPYGGIFAALMQGLSHRCGEKFTNSPMMPYNGWAYFTHSAMEAIIKAAASAEVFEPSVTDTYDSRAIGLSATHYVDHACEKGLISRWYLLGYRSNTHKNCVLEVAHYMYDMDTFTVLYRPCHLDLIENAGGMKELRNYITGESGVDRNFSSFSWPVVQ